MRTTSSRGRRRTATRAGNWSSWKWVRPNTTEEHDHRPGPCRTASRATAGAGPGRTAPRRSARPITTISTSRTMPERVVGLVGQLAGRLAQVVEVVAGEPRATGSDTSGTRRSWASDAERRPRRARRSAGSGARSPRPRRCPWWPRPRPARRRSPSHSGGTGGREPATAGRPRRRRRGRSRTPPDDRRAPAPRRSSSARPSAIERRRRGPTAAARRPAARDGGVRRDGHGGEHRHGRGAVPVGAPTAPAVGRRGRQEAAAGTTESRRSRSCQPRGTGGRAAWRSHRSWVIGCASAASGSIHTVAAA